MTDPIGTAVQVTDLSSLRPGERVEARSNGMPGCSGTVDATAPDFGVIWIHEDPGGNRRLLHRDDYSLWLRHPRSR